ncbi:MAG: metal ABC transporter substrate-binding protein [Candidatus Roizmanbacteria bacterium]|nr:metal ABC transporter substrate-binding protein [Candidatus Roizmanbacteria bacterium]
MFVIIVGIFFLSPSRQQSPQTVSVVASIYPYGFLAQAIGADDIVVSVIVPPGAEAHDFEPSPKDIAKLEEADVVIANGAGIEPWLDEVQKTRSRLQKPTLIMAPDAVDPHVWLDPNTMKRFAAILSDELSRVDPQRASVYAQRTVVLQKQLTALDARMKQTLSNCEYTSAIVAHDAFGYFGRAYDIKLIPIAGISHEDEPSAKKIAELIDLIRSNQIHAVYFESYADPTLSQTLVEETGVISLPLDPAETISDDDSATTNYLTIMEENRKQLQKGLVCQ